MYCRSEYIRSLKKPSYLQLNHSAIQDIFVGRGGAVRLQHVAGVSHPVLQLFQALGEKLVLSDYSVDP